MPHESSVHQDKGQQRWLVEIQRLQSDRTFRDCRGAFFIEGVRNVVQAVESGWPVETLIVSDRLLTASVARRLVRDQQQRGSPLVSLSPEAFRQISKTERASGIAAIVKQRWDRLHQSSPKAGLCWVALAEVRSPGNLGSLIRTAEAVGAAGFILIGTGVDPFDPAVVRASMGSIFQQRFARTKPASLRHWARKHGVQVVGASPDGSTEYHRHNYQRPTVLLLGEERKGLTDHQRRLCSQLVRIPMTGRADSLNIAVAGSLLLYEVYRGRAAKQSHRSRPRRRRGP